MEKKTQKTEQQSLHMEPIATDGLLVANDIFGIGESLTFHIGKHGSQTGSCTLSQSLQFCKLACCKQSSFWLTSLKSAMAIDLHEILVFGQFCAFFFIFPRVAIVSMSPKD